MSLDESLITKAIVDNFTKDFRNITNVDVVIVGAGPSGITAARYLAKEGFSVVVFEKNLYVGGGIWGGGIMFPKIVVQEEAKTILEEVGVKLKKVSQRVYVADSVETVSKCTASAIEAGAKVMVGFNVEDVVFRNSKDGFQVCGVVLNWAAVEKAGLHVDPVAIKSRVVIDSTGHEAGIVRVIMRKLPEIRLQTKTGEVIGEKPMWVEAGEVEVVKNTCEVLPGLFVAGMAVNTVFGLARMGPIFGGMFLSGKKVAELVNKKLRKS